MDSLLTTKQVQDYLKVDRTTIYRMLKDGRLLGVRIGNQWRFAREAIDALMSGVVTSEQSSESQKKTPLPLHCIQPIQDVFADIARVGSLTTAPDGTPLTTISNPCRFCSLILASESGRSACVASWRKLASQPETRPQFVECHAGLHYARARIEIDGKLDAMVIAGQFYAARPNEKAERARVEELALRHGIDLHELEKSAEEIPVVDGRMESQIGSWLEKIAHTFEHFGRERLDLMGRLRKIAAMTGIHSS
jgi:excisionase family DNA binding protein